MTTYLFDANVLIALAVEEHQHHERASAWASSVSSFATCPIVEGALVRFLVRMGESHATAVAILRAVHDRRGFQLWPDNLSYLDVDLAAVRGHRQVTDLYLVALTRSRPRALLATMDEGLVSVAPKGTFLVPVA